MNNKVTSKSPRIWAIAALVITTLFWSGNFIAGRAIRDDIPPLELNMIRWCISITLLLPFIVKGLYEQRREIMASWKLIVLLGLTGIAAFHTITYHALSLTPAVNCLLILALAPVATVIGGSIWNGFRPTRLQVFGLIASICGAVYLVLAGADGVSVFDLDAGKLWMILAILIWAWYTLLLRRRPPELRQDVTLGASIIVALIAMGICMSFKGAQPVALTSSSILSVLYIGIFASLLGFLLWGYGISVIGAEIGGQFVHLMPIFGSLLAVLVLGENISTQHMIGAAFIIVGLVLVNRKTA